MLAAPSRARPDRAGRRPHRRRPARRTASGRFSARDRGKRLQIQSVRSRSRQTADSLDYMHARYYSPQIGRFFSFDPAGGSLKTPQGWNHYSYGLGNPVKYVDPYGLQAGWYYLWSNTPIARFNDSTVVTASGIPLPSFNFLGFGNFLRNIGFFNSLPFAATGSPRAPRISSSSVCRALIPRPAPPGVNLGQNILDAQGHRWNMLWLINQVQTGGPWDYKKHSQGQFEAFGNFNYGLVTSAMGVPQDISLLAAGVYQAISRSSKADWIFPAGAESLNPTSPFFGPLLQPPHGDDPRDQANIAFGMVFYEQCVQ